MFAIRQSLLEQFRRYVQLDYITDEEMIAHVKGEYSPNEKMQAGTAWHALLASFSDPRKENEIPEPELVKGQWLVHIPVEGTDGFWFDAETAEECASLIGPGLVEVPGSKKFTVSTHRGSTDVLLTGTADHIRGKLIQDSKTIFGTPDARDYESSLQWRIYSLLFDADCFRYNLWHFAEADEDNFCRYKSHLAINFWRYENMEQDILGWLRRMMDWLEVKGLTQHLEKGGK